MPEIKNLSCESMYWKYDATVFSVICGDYFGASYWKSLDKIIGQESGRGTTYFVEHSNGSEQYDLVLRHYLRGGLMSRLSKDNYLFKNIQNCRSISEFDILLELDKRSLPVPRPIAAQVRRLGLCYQADLITQKIPSASDLVQVLREPQSDAFYQEMGETVASFHLAGVFHADLNIQNILYDKNKKFWLIDFDKAKLLEPHRRWQQKNLDRLKRSFEKEVIRHKIQWQTDNWIALEQSYWSAIQRSK